MSKGVKIEIPIIGIILIIATFLGVSYIKNRSVKKKDKEIAELQYKIDSTNIVIQIDKKKIVDTVTYYEAIINEHDKKIEAQEGKIKEKDKELEEIKETVTDLSNDSIYEITQEYLPEPSDSLNLIYSGNQVREIYQEHLEKIKMHEVILEYRIYAGELEIGVRQRDEQLSNYYDLIEVHERDLENKAAENMLLQGENDQLRKDVKFWKIMTGGAGVGGLALGLLFVL